MARTRLLHPEFFLNEQLGELTPIHSVLFSGLWTQADKEGRLEDRPGRLKLQVLPWWKCDVAQLLGDLDALGLIRRYEVDGEHYICIPKFQRWQKPHPREKASMFPPPPLKGVDEPCKGQTQPCKGDVEPGDPVSVSDPVSDPVSKTNIRQTPGASPPDPRVSVEERVFAHWQTHLGHPEAKLDPKRRRLIQAALKLGYSEEQLLIAIAGCATSPYHLGQNETRTRYDSLGLILRDAEHIDRFIAIRTKPQATGPPRSGDVNAAWERAEGIR